MPLVRDEQQAALSLGGWSVVAELLGQPADHEYGGGSAPRYGRPGEWLEYDSKLIVVGPMSGGVRNPKGNRLSVKWARIRKHGATLPPDLLDDLRAVRRKSQDLALAAHEHWRYSAAMSAEEREQMDKWVRDHCEQSRANVAEMGRLLRAALPLADRDDIHDAHGGHEVRVVESDRARCITCHLWADEDPEVVEAERRARYGIAERAQMNLLELLDAMP